MESNITIRAANSDINAFFEDNPVCSVRMFHTNGDGTFKASIRHTELPAPLKGEFTIPEICSTLTCFWDAYRTFKEIAALIAKAQQLFENAPKEIQDAVLKYHNETATIQYCPRWGAQAAENIVSDWHTIASSIPREDK